MLVMVDVRIRSVVRSADTANDVATKILAAGLRATNELPEREPLRFNIVLSHYNEPRAPFPAQAEAALTQLLAAVKEMNDGSGKAIRFLKL